MWPFAPKKKTQSLPPKETSAEEDWDISLWLLDPDRTADELTYFAEKGRRPTEFIKMPPKASPKEDFAVVEHLPQGHQSEKPAPDFPKNPARADTYFDRQTGTYYTWSGVKWKVIANIPPQKPSLLGCESVDEWFDNLNKERYFNIVSLLKRPRFESQLQEKQWCAREASKLLECDIQVHESRVMGLIVIDGREFQHPIENWGWYGKTSEEFFEHLYRLWASYTTKEND